MRKTLLSIVALCAITASAQYKSQVWSPDNGDGTYTNPVINADYSDPDVSVGESLPPTPSPGGGDENQGLRTKGRSLFFFARHCAHSA